MDFIDRFAIRSARASVLIAAVVIGACADSPSMPGLVATSASSIESWSITGQTAFAGEPVDIAPTVVVRDNQGTPLGGIMVTFVVTRGGGSIERTRVTTSVDGVASGGLWRLGPNAGENEVEARVGTLTPVRFTATARAGSNFDITVRYVSQPTIRQMTAVASAVDRWRAAIVDDLNDVPMTVAAGTCSANQPAVNEIVDDLLLFVEFKEIDGAGKVLGEAGPCYVRSESGLPIIGYMRLDAADLAQMEQAGTLDDVVLHELGHILGIGTLWKGKSFVANAGTSDPFFTGPFAVSEYRILGGLTAGVPVENTGDAGTREGHWRESVFVNELMTGWVGSTPNPLSAMTIASLRDLGYGASLQAAAGYVLGGTTQGATMSIDLREREKITGPRFKVDRRGLPERIEPPGLD